MSSWPNLSWADCWITYIPLIFDYRLPYGVTIGMIAGSINDYSISGQSSDYSSVYYCFVIKSIASFKVFLVYIEQLIESRLLQPLILVHHQDNPVTILVGSTQLLVNVWANRIVNRSPCLCSS